MVAVSESNPACALFWGFGAYKGDAGEQISRVRVTSGATALVSNGVRSNENDDFVVMDDFL